MQTKSTRQVIVHYHLFKNAGSTIDHILQNNFGNGWLPFDGEKAHSRIQAPEIEQLILQHPEVQAVSSHNAVLPIPAIAGISIAPIVFLRHPLDRVRSIYDFERKQGQKSGPVSQGAEHASKLDFNDYIKWRFDTCKNGVTHNYHTAWLLHDPRFNRFEITQKDFELAVQNLKELPFFGLVERFDDSLKLLSQHLTNIGIHITTDYQVKNSTKHREKPMADKLDSLRENIGDDIWSQIVSRNHWDLELYKAAQELFESRLARLN